jgi:hypothetical protein
MRLDGPSALEVIDFKGKSIATPTREILFGGDFGRHCQA